MAENQILNSSEWRDFTSDASQPSANPSIPSMLGNDDTIRWLERHLRPEGVFGSHSLARMAVGSKFGAYLQAEAPFGFLRPTAKDRERVKGTGLPVNVEPPKLGVEFGCLSQQFVAVRAGRAMDHASLVQHVCILCARRERV